MTENRNIQRLTALVSYGLFPLPMNPLLFADADRDDWASLHTLCAANGVESLSYNGILTLPELLRPEQALLTDWKFAHTRATLTGQWQVRLLVRVMDELNAHGISAVSFGDTDICKAYPKVDMRPINGIDVLVPSGKTEEAAELLAPSKWSMNENRRAEITANGAKIYITDSPCPAVSGKCGEAMERFISSHLDNTEPILLHGRKFPIMDEELRCLSLLSSIGEGLRDGTADILSLCDWAMFLHASPDPAKWEKRFNGILYQSGLTFLAVYLTACAVTFLGLPDSPWSVDVSPEAVERLFSAMLKPCPDAVEKHGAQEGVFSGIAEKRPAAVCSAHDERIRRQLISELHLFESGE